MVLRVSYYILNILVGKKKFDIITQMIEKKLKHKELI